MCTLESEVHCTHTPCSANHPDHTAGTGHVTPSPAQLHTAPVRCLAIPKNSLNSGNDPETHSHFLLLKPVRAGEVMQGWSRSVSWEGRPLDSQAFSVMWDSKCCLHGVRGRPREWGCTCSLRATRDEPALQERLTQHVGALKAQPLWPPVLRHPETAGHDSGAPGLLPQWQTS